jgi:hypothetical protein
VSRNRFCDFLADPGSRSFGRFYTNIGRSRYPTALLPNSTDRIYIDYDDCDGLQNGAQNCLWSVHMPVFPMGTVGLNGSETVRTCPIKLSTAPPLVWRPPSRPPTAGCRNTNQSCRLLRISSAVSQPFFFSFLAILHRRFRSPPHRLVPGGASSTGGHSIPRGSSPPPHG